MSEEEIKHLEGFTPFYRKGDYMDDLLIEREVDIIRRYCGGKRDRSALEVGCGNGVCTALLADMLPNLEVVEPAKGNIELLRQRLPHVVCHNALLENFAGARRYDFIFFLNVIEHVEEPIESLKKLHSLLADDGLIFISAPNCMSLNRRAGIKMGLLSAYDQFAPKDHLVGHRRLYTRAMLEEHCDRAGLRLVDVKGLYLKPLSEQQMYGLGEAAIRAFLALGEEIPEYCASLLGIATKKYY